jgi:hypothetical protein
MTWQDKPFQKWFPLMLERFAGLCKSKINSVLVAVATRFPDASVMFASVNPIRDPALTTVPVAISVPLDSVTALR